MSLYCFISVFAAFPFDKRLSGLLFTACGLVSFCCLVLNVCFCSYQNNKKAKKKLKCRKIVMYIYLYIHIASARLCTLHLFSSLYVNDQTAWMVTTTWLKYPALELYSGSLLA